MCRRSTQSTDNVVSFFGVRKLDSMSCCWLSFKLDRMSCCWLSREYGVCCLEFSSISKITP